MRNAWVDFKPGGAVVYADVNMKLGWQRVGAVFKLDPSARQLIFAGLDVDGDLYSAPPEGQVGDAVRELEDTSNRALRELKFVDPEGNLFIRQIEIGENGAKDLVK